MNGNTVSNYRNREILQLLPKVFDEDDAGNGGDDGVLFMWIKLV